MLCTDVLPEWVSLQNAEKKSNFAIKIFLDGKDHQRATMKWMIQNKQ